MKYNRLLLLSIIFTGSLASASSVSAAPPKNSLGLLHHFCRQEHPRHTIDLHKIYTYICQKNSPQVFPWKNQTL